MVDGQQHPEMRGNSPKRRRGTIHVGNGGHAATERQRGLDDRDEIRGKPGNIPGKGF